MRDSRLDQLILDDGWKGTCTRVFGIALVYLGLLYLPDIIAKASVHWHFRPMSEKQSNNHEGLLFVFRILFGFAIVLEGIRVVCFFVRKRSRS